MPTLFEAMFQEMDKSNEHIQKFDEVIACIIKICDKQSSRTTKGDQEELWKHALKNVFSIKDKVYKLIVSKENQSDSEDLRIEERENFERFLSQRN